MGSLNILLRPSWDAGSVSGMVVEYEFAGEPLICGSEKPALDYPDQAFGRLCPFPDYELLSLADDAGNMPYTLAESPTFYTAATCKGFYFERPVEGTLRWSTQLWPRVLPEGYRSSPYYDFRAEPGGLNGSGMFSLILPVVEGPMDVRLSWDLSALPAGARAISSFGEGTVERRLTAFELRFSLFNVGLMHAVEEGGLGVYWFEEPYFDVRGVAERLGPIYRYERDYFGDSESSFSVFLRRDPFEISGGGSACPHAFISGYSAFGGTDETHWFNVLVHEMTHTWPAMTDFNVGEGTWFSEGATEFYCTMLPYRGGFIDAATTAGYLNEKIGDRYYRNPYRETSNDQIPAVQWKDRRAQTVPYGRGFIYLANVDHELRERGLGSIDDAVRGRSITDPLTPGEWRSFVQERLGEKGVADFECMCAGELVLPCEGVFGPEFRLVEEEGQVFRWEAVA